MDAWIQYTLDFTERPEGVLTLGGWATKQICYKNVRELQVKNAGFGTSQIAGDLIEQFQNQIELLHWIPTGYDPKTRKGNLVYYDEYLYVFKIFADETSSRAKQTLIGLAIFVRTIPIHVEQDLMDFLKANIEWP